ncbi:HAD family hydrolase [Streptosporangium saharense]|uniref:HAD family hydrolase n=1 Tax=Streptosporangium saharense TaxID=1706840 RepID=UPI00369409EB
MGAAKGAAVDLGRISAVVLDTDGVITDTARVHAAAWKQVFDPFLSERREEPFDVGLDYPRHVDGKSREDGVADFLRSRGIPADPETVAALAARKDACFLAEIDAHGVTPFASTVAFVGELRRRGVRVAAVSASRNCARVLRAAGVGGLFDVRVDGVEAARLGLPGKPDPALFLRAAELLGAAPERTAVVEDSLAGVLAGRRGGFGLVVGLDRNDLREELRAAGADVVVGDLAELRLDGRDGGSLAAGL